MVNGVRIRCSLRKRLENFYKDMFNGGEWKHVRLDNTIFNTIYGEYNEILVGIITENEML